MGELTFKLSLFPVANTGGKKVDYSECFYSLAGILIWRETNKTQRVLLPYLLLFLFLIAKLNQPEDDDEDEDDEDAVPVEPVEGESEEVSRAYNVCI